MARKYRVYSRNSRFYVYRKRWWGWETKRHYCPYDVSYTQTKYLTFAKAFDAANEWKEEEGREKEAMKEQWKVVYETP